MLHGLALHWATASPCSPQTPTPASGPRGSALRSSQQSALLRASAHIWGWPRLSPLAPYPAGALVPPTPPGSGLQGRIARFPGGRQVGPALLTPRPCPGTIWPRGPESGGFQGPAAGPVGAVCVVGRGGEERKSLLLPPRLSWLCLTWLWPQQPSWMGICLQTSRGLGYPFSAAVPSLMAAPRGGS